MSGASRLPTLTSYFCASISLNYLAQGPRPNTPMLTARHRPPRAPITPMLQAVQDFETISTMAKFIR